MAYAAKTEVEVEETRMEIERLVKRHGATEFGTIITPKVAQVAFAAHERRVRFSLPLPNPESSYFALTKEGKRRTKAAAQEAWEQACRSRWRALFLTIKAKLTSVESGIETFETAFLAHIILPGTEGETVAQYALPRLAAAYQTGEAVALLPAPGRA